MFGSWLSLFLSLFLYERRIFCGFPFNLVTGCLSKHCTWWMTSINKVHQSWARKHGDNSITVLPPPEGAIALPLTMHEHVLRHVHRPAFSHCLGRFLTPHTHTRMHTHRHTHTFFSFKQWNLSLIDACLLSALCKCCLLSKPSDLWSLLMCKVAKTWSWIWTSSQCWESETLYSKLRPVSHQTLNSWTIKGREYFEYFYLTGIIWCYKVWP